MIYPDLPHDVNSPTHPVSAMDYMHVEPLRALQLHRLQWTVKYAYERVPLFRKRCEERGVRPEHIKTLAAIRNVPFTPTPLNADFTWNGRIAGRPALFLLTNPNAPTGVLTAPETVAAAARRFKGVLVVDEAYADFARTNCVPLATAAANRNVIVMRTLSKSFSLAGLRLGYCIGPEDLIAALYKVKDSYNVDALAQAVACAALNDLPWMRGNVAKVRKTRARVAQELARRGWDVLPSESNFLFARPAHRPAAELFEALRRKNIFVRYFKGPRTGDRLRMTIGTDAEMDALLAALATLDCTLQRS